MSQCDFFVSFVSLSVWDEATLGLRVVLVQRSVKFELWTGIPSGGGCVVLRNIFYTLWNICIC